MPLLIKNLSISHLKIPKCLGLTNLAKQISLHLHSKDTSFYSDIVLWFYILPLLKTSFPYPLYLGLSLFGRFQWDFLPSSFQTPTITGREPLNVPHTLTQIIPGIILLNLLWTLSNTSTSSSDMQPKPAHNIPKVASPAPSKTSALHPCIYILIPLKLLFAFHLHPIHSLAWSWGQLAAALFPQLAL